MERIAYDEFSFFHENLSEWDLDLPVPPVRRERFPVDETRDLSALVWGANSAEFLLVHGGAQNAHTFDTVALALQRSLVAVDLPGHGHSDASPFGLAASAADAPSEGGRWRGGCLPRGVLGVTCMSTLTLPYMSKWGLGACACS